MDEQSLPVFASAVTDMFAKFDTAQAHVITQRRCGPFSFCHCAARSIPHRVILYMYVLRTSLCLPRAASPATVFITFFFEEGQTTRIEIWYVFYNSLGGPGSQSAPFSHAQYWLRHTAFSDFLRFLLLTPLDFMGKSASSVRYTFQPIAAPGRQYGRGAGSRTT